MQITIDENNNISVKAEELSAYSRKSSSKSFYGFNSIEDESFDSKDFSQEYFTVVNGIRVVSNVEHVDVFDGVAHIYKYFEKDRITANLSPVSDVRSFSNSVVASYCVLKSKGIDFAKLYIIFINKKNSRKKVFEADFKIDFLSKMTEVLVERAMPFILKEKERMTECIPSLKNLPFPYETIRDVQKTFIGDAFRTIKKGNRLLVTAPTGVGKTVSALYPALRAVGAGCVDKIFYLTAKTETGIAARDTCRSMLKYVSTLKCVSILAKERVCPSAMRNREGVKSSNKCRHCPLLETVNGVLYEKRRDAALIELLDNNIIDTEIIKQIAEKYCLCPYELSLDISEYAEVIICDYNYAFDPRVRIRRYFVEDNNLRFVFLADEAHNIPDRAREMYSSVFNTDEFLRIYKYRNDIFMGAPELRNSVEEMAVSIGEVINLCRQEEQVDSQDNTAGFYISSVIPDGLIASMEKFVEIARSSSKKDEELATNLEELVDLSSNFISISNIFDDGFKFFAELVNNKLVISIRCLDPSKMLDKMMKSAMSSILFSATLTPMDYFADILGCRDAATLELDSPYDPGNLCLFAYDGISTRYQDRDDTYEDIAEIVASVVESKEGNYLVYFPSYSFMSKVYESFCEMAPEYHAIVQNKNMTVKDRKLFLDSFRNDCDESVIGFCVLGGVFSEGVDLQGERLIGSIIVGTGLPGISSEQNILKDYFDSTRENGFDYAYRYPAMIKVLQAAGRVIRSEEDTGVVILIDDRYGEPTTYSLFPNAWRKNIKYTADPYSLNSALMTFWDSH